MAANVGWRLLAAYSLILVVPALRGQNIQTNRPDLFLSGQDVRSRSTSAPVGLPLNPPVFRGGLGQHLVPKMIHASGIIFSGRVISVSRADPRPGEQATPTVVTFFIQHAIRGAVAGQNLTIREWPGLWNRGERYRVGEHVFLFLYPPSRLGLTSPVAGRFGRLAMDSQERILLSPEAGDAFAPDLVFERTERVPYADFKQALQNISNEK